MHLLCLESIFRLKITFLRERDRETERQRERDREREKERKRETEGDRGRQRERGGEHPSPLYRMTRSAGSSVPLLWVDL